MVLSGELAVHLAGTQGVSAMRGRVGRWSSGPRKPSVLRLP